MKTQASQWLIAATLMALLAACGGGDDAVLAAPVVVQPPVVIVPSPVVVSTTVTGAVVKGPVAAAQVCGYAVAAKARGAALGNCATTDASGNYTLTVPVGSGALWVEASGGTYIDETTALSTSLPAGSTLRALVTANGGNVVTMLTPLTTLALNAAISSSAANLDAAAFQAAVLQLLSSFNLPATLNLSTTLPVFGSSINDYGTALTIISKMLANGTTNGTSLQALLATAQPSTLATAYAAAAAPPVPVVVGPPPVVNNATANGTLTFTGANAAVAAFGNLTPQTDGFSVAVKTGEENYGSNLNTPSGTTYRFFKTVNDSAGVPTVVELVITRSSATNGNGNNITYSYGKNKNVSCNGCTATSVSTPAGATHPVTFTFTDLKLNFDLTLNGTLVGDVTGDAVGALWSPAQLPGTTTGDAAVSGVAFAPTDSILNSFGEAAKFILADGTLLEVNGNTANYYGRLGVYSCFSNCGITAVLDPNGTGTTFSFANSKLALPNFGSADPAGRTLTGSISVRRSNGRVTSTSLGTFSVVTSMVQAVNGAFVNTYTQASAGERAGVLAIEVTRRGDQVSGVLVTLGFAGNGQTYACKAAATAAVPACSGITVSSDGLTVLFNNTTMAGSLAVAGVLPTQTFTGNMVAKGR
jgi:hypothetical protein